MSDAPSLADAFTDLAPRTRGPRCSIAVLIETIAATDAAGADALRAVLDGPAPSSAIAEKLHGRGHRVQAQTLNRHRKRGTANGCSCPQ